MGKIKLNLVSGAIVEKPLVNAFKVNNISYVILDNEMNGSMGLPIILVCKFENNKLVKILDQNEWGLVKEYLKNIIAGGQVEFINVGSEIAADDIYYTQLTLPVPSFDALKNAYKVDSAVPTPEITPIQVTPEPVSVAEPTPIAVNPIPVVEPTPVEVGPSPVTEPVSVVEPVIPQSIPVVDIPAMPQSENPSVESVPMQEIVMPVAPTPMASAEVPVVEPAPVEVGPIPVSEPVPAIEPVVAAPSMENTFKEQKEAFMQACENMFDALVQKFEKELESRK